MVGELADFIVTADHPGTAPAKGRYGLASSFVGGDITGDTILPCPFRKLGYLR